MNTVHKKNTAIEALRFIFMLIICVHHFGGTHMKHGYIAVEFFFILSGVMLMKSFMKPNRRGLVDYLCHRIKHLYPEYFIACLFSGIVLWAIFRDAYIAGSLSDSIRRFINTLLLLNGSGVFIGGFNITLWYVVVLIIGGFIIYALLDYNQKLSLKVIFPILILLYFTFCFNKGESIERWQVEGGVFYNPLWRGTAGLALGTILFYLFRNYGNKLNMEALNLISCFSFVLALVLLFAPAFYDSYFLLLFPTIIIGALFQESWLNRLFCSDKWITVGGITYEMYLLHIPIKGIIGSIADKTELHLSHAAIITSYVALTILSAYLLQIIYKAIQKRYHV